MLVLPICALQLPHSWTNFRFQGSDMFETLMEMFRHILLLLPCTTGVSGEGWHLREQGLSRPILSTSSIRIGDGRFGTAGVIQSQHGAF